MKYNRIILGDNIKTLKTLPDNSIDCCITSPPYFNLRDYGNIPGQIGLEKTPEKFIEKLIDVFNEVYRVLKDCGTCFVVIGDSYNGSGKNNGNTNPMEAKQRTNAASHLVKPLLLKTIPVKSLIGIPWKFAFAMINTGWILRQDIIWSKPAPMPESVKDRFCKSHEYIFFFSKNTKYFFDHKYALEPAVSYDDRKSIEIDYDSLTRGYATKSGNTGLKENRHGKNIPIQLLRTKRDVWNIAAESSVLEHYAMFPQKLILPILLCACPKDGVVLDPFIGSGTTAVVAVKNFRKYIGCEINSDYIKIAEKRIAAEKGLWDE